MQSSQAGEQVHVSTEGHGAQSSTKQWTQLRQQVSDLRQTVRARDATIVRLHSFLASADGKPGGAASALRVPICKPAPCFDSITRFHDKIFDHAPALPSMQCAQMQVHTTLRKWHNVHL